MKHRFVPCMILVALGISWTGVARADLLSRADKNGDRIHNLLDQAIAGKHTPPTSVLFSFHQPPTPQELKDLRQHGGAILKVWTDIVQAALVEIDSDGIKHALSSNPNIAFVEPDQMSSSDLYRATMASGARRAWVRNPSAPSPYAIAILDTGMDASHPDLNGSVVAWHDVVGAHREHDNDEYASPADMSGHGTFVASAAAGAGNPDGVFALSAADYLPQDGHGWAVTVPVYPGNTLSDIQVSLHLGDTDGKYWIRVLAGDQQVAYHHAGPADLRLNAPLSLPPDTGEVKVKVGGSLRDFYNSSGKRYHLQVRTRQHSADAYPLHAGAAPAARLCAVKIRDDEGRGYVSNFLDGADWVLQHRVQRQIVAVNDSSSFDAVSIVVEQAVENLIDSGVAFVTSAGNTQDRGGQVTSPGSVERSIVVGATNFEGEVAGYSNGGAPSGPIKPDFMAFGGSMHQNVPVFVADSNHGDQVHQNGAVHHMADPFPGDYSMSYGTSISAPQIAGAIAEIAAFLPGWSWQDDSSVRKAKALLAMAAWETKGGERDHPGLPGRSVALKDATEGYGLVAVDAVIEGITTPLQGTETASLGEAWDLPKAFMRRLDLSSGEEVRLALEVPSGLDADLYLYAAEADSNGAPQLLAASDQPVPGADEGITLTAPGNGSYYVVARHLSGEGAITLRRARETPPSIALAGYLGTDLSSSHGGTLDILAVVNGDASGYGVELSATPGTALPLDGNGSGTYQLTLPIEGSLPEMALRMEMRVTSLGAGGAGLAWPYLNVER